MSKSGLRVCRRCGDKVNIVSEPYHADGRKYYHANCWRETLNEQILGLEPTTPSKKRKAPVKKDMYKDYVYQIATEQMNMTSTAIDNKVKQLISDGLTMKDIARGLRYYLEVLNREPQDYGLWVAERYVSAANKHYDRINEINETNQKLIQRITLSSVERVEVSFKGQKWKTSVKEIQMD